MKTYSYENMHKNQNTTHKHQNFLFTYFLFYNATSTSSIPTTPSSSYCTAHLHQIHHTKIPKSITPISKNFISMLHHLQMPRPIPVPSPMALWAFMNKSDLNRSCLQEVAEEDWKVYHLGHFSGCVGRCCWWWVIIHFQHRHVEHSWVPWYEGF